MYSKFDENCGYRKVDISERDRVKPTFALDQELYQFIDLLSTFQPMMDVILLRIQWQVAFACLDDIVIFSKSPRA